MAVQRAVPPVARVGALTVLLAVASLTVPLRGRPTVLEHLPQLSWWLLALFFAVTEAWVLQLRRRDEAASVSLSEVPLVLGLFLAVPHDLLLGRLVGSAVVFVAYRRQTAVKAAFNTALVGAGTAAAVAAFGGVLVLVAPLLGEDPLGPGGWLAAVVAVVLGGLLDAAALLLVVGWYSGPVGSSLALREVGTSVFLPGLLAILGVAAVVVVRQTGSVVPVAVVGLIALLGYRAFASLSQRHATLEQLYRLSDALAAAPAAAEVVGLVLRQAGELLRAGYVEILLTEDGDGAQVLGDRRGGGRIDADVAEPLAPAAVGPDPSDPAETGQPAVAVVCWSWRPGGETVARDGAALAACGPAFPPPAATLVRSSGPEQRAFLAARDVHEAVVVPLRVDDRVVGHLLVAERTGQDRGFTEGDVRLLETVANHGSIALRNGRLLERLHVEARHDELTALPNRLYFRHRLDDAAAVAADGGPPCAVMVLDFDGFKAINDTLGHQAGDDLLRVIAARLSGAGGQDAFVARLGGDEFAVLSTTSGRPQDAVALAARLLTVFDDPVAVAGARIRVGGSLGIALGPEHGVSGSDLLRSADIAMYAAKAGAGGARLFTPDLADSSTTVLTLAADLRDAMARGDIGIAVQPLVHLSSGAVHSVEVLARWRHPEVGEISPEALFVAADRAAQVVQLSGVILDQALALCRELHEAGRAVRVAVNLAPRWLADPGLPEHVGLALARHGVPADLLCLEIVESGVIADPRRAIETLGRLRAMGVHLSVDDFGTGYSSLTYLSRLPVDQLKVDKTFVLRLQDSGRDRAIVRSIISLGRHLGLEVVAEGVSEPGTRRALQEMGCALAQGYLFSRPLDPHALPAFLDAQPVPVPGPLLPPQRSGAAVDDEVSS